MESLQVGQSLSFVRVVAPQHTARYFKSGDLLVFATPAMLTWFEEAAVALVAPTLSDEQTSVGTQIEARHVAPVPVGGRITITVTVTAVEGKRISFATQANIGETLVGEGTHQRVVVERDLFMAKADTMAAERGL